MSEASVTETVASGLPTLDPSCTTSEPVRSVSNQAATALAGFLSGPTWLESMTVLLEPQVGKGGGADSLAMQVCSTSMDVHLRPVKTKVSLFHLESMQALLLQSPQALSDRQT